MPTILKVVRCATPQGTVILPRGAHDGGSATLTQSSSPSPAKLLGAIRWLITASHPPNYNMN